MALNTQLSNAAANAAADAIATLLNTGYLRIYTGSQPADGNTALGAQVLLAELRFAASAFGGSVAGVATAAAISAVNAGATGTATWFRALKSDGTSVVLDGTVGTAGCNLNLNSTAIASGAQVQVTGFTLTEQEAGS